MNRATLQYLELIDRVKSEVRLSRVRLLQASDQLEHWRAGFLPVVLETVELAKSAYSNGDISYLELQKTRRPLLEANAFEVVIVLDLKKALIELERAVGRRL